MAQPYLILLHIALIFVTGSISYLLWRLAERKFLSLFPGVHFCAIIVEVFYLFFYTGWATGAAIGLSAVIIICSVIGGKVHLLSGGASKELFHAFHLLFLSSVTSISLSAYIVLRHFPLRLSPISMSLATTFAVVALASPMVTAFVWYIFQKLAPRPNFNPDDAPPIANV